MKITAQTLLASTLENQTNVKKEEKFQISKGNETKEMSEAEEMADFKNKFYEEISQIRCHSTVSNMAINVSEEAFQAMKDDPEYREKVISLIKRDCGGSYAPRDCSLLITIGASTQEYRADAWPVGYDSEFHMRSQNSFYKNKSKRKEEQEEILEEYLEKRWQARKLQQELEHKRSVSQAFMAYEANA